MSRDEVIEILSDIRAEYNLFGDEKEATRYHVLSWAIKEMKAMLMDRKTGRWILKKTYEDEYGNEQFKYFCSECDTPAYEFSQPYCHRCGAKMDEVEK